MLQNFCCKKKLLKAILLDFCCNVHETNVMVCFDESNCISPLNKKENESTGTTLSKSLVEY